MGKKIAGGKKNKKYRKDSVRKTELVFREDEQAYARITRSMGDSRFECNLLETNENVVGHVRGTLKKRMWMKVGDFVLVSLRNFDKSKCDIIHKYTNDEVYSLKNMGEIPSDINICASNFEITSGTNESNELIIDFDNV